MYPHIYIYMYIYIYIYIPLHPAPTAPPCNEYPETL